MVFLLLNKVYILLYFPAGKYKRLRPEKDEAVCLRNTTCSAYAACAVIYAPVNGGFRHSLQKLSCVPCLEHLQLLRPCSSGVIFVTVLLVPVFHRRRVAEPFRLPYCLHHSLLHIAPIINREEKNVKPLLKSRFQTGQVLPQWIHSRSPAPYGVQTSLQPKDCPEGHQKTPPFPVQYQTGK